jgi:uncharacterized membrane protein
MTVLVLAFLIGVVAGLRTMTALAAVSWAAQIARVPLAVTWLAFLAPRSAALGLSFLAIVELITDQLPSTPSRTVPVQFGARIISGAISGAAIGSAVGHMMLGSMLGITGAFVGTLGGHRVRARLAAAFGNDHTAALIEDAAAVGLASSIVLALR